VSWFERSLAVWETVAGADHLDLAYPLASVGEARFQMGQPQAAIEPLERALALLDAEVSLRENVTALLAQALWDAGEDRGRALELAAEAHRALSARGPAASDHLRALERWYERIGHEPPRTE
jgi:eukaryotic-like serine/threonine-protein kinase